MTDDNRQKTRPPTRRRTPSKCPICGAPTVPEARPFCSRRCADRDLGRWLTGGYRIPTDERLGDAPSAESETDGAHSNSET